MSACVSPPHESVSHIVAVAPSIAQAASTALPPFWNAIAPAVAPRGLPVIAIQWRPCSGGFCVRCASGLTGDDASANSSADSTHANSLLLRPITPSVLSLLNWRTLPTRLLLLLRGPRILRNRPRPTRRLSTHRRDAMRKILLGLCLLSLLAPGAASRQGPPELSRETREFITVDAPAVALAHVRVIDGTGGPALVDQTVVISAGRILSVGPAATAKVP